MSEWVEIFNASCEIRSLDTMIVEAKDYEGGEKPILLILSKKGEEVGSVMFEKGKALELAYAIIKHCE